MLSRFSHVRLFATLRTVVHQAPLSMGFSRQDYWSGLPCPLQGAFLTQRLSPSLLQRLHWQAGSLPPALPGKTPAVLYSFQVYNIVTPYFYRQHAMLIYSSIIDCIVLHSPVTCLFDNRELVPPGLFLNAPLRPRAQLLSSQSLGSIRV